MTFLRRKGFNVIKLCIVRAILGAQGPRYLFSRATKERGRTQFEGLGPQYRSYNTQFYNIEAFSSQKDDKTFIFLNFPRFPRILEKKIMTTKKNREFNFGKPGKRPQA